MGIQIAVSAKDFLGAVKLNHLAHDIREASNNIHNESLDSSLIKI